MSKEVRPASPGSRHHQVTVELLSQAYRALPMSLFATLLNGLILCFAMWTIMPKIMVVAWFVALVFICLWRYTDYLYFRNEKLDAEDDKVIGGRFDLLARLTGVLWGIAGYGFFTIESSIHLGFLAFLLAGMTAGAVSTLAVRTRTAQVYLVVSLIPFALQLFLQGMAIYTAMGVMVLLFLGLGIINTKRLGQNVIENIQLRLQSADNEIKLREQDELLQQTGNIGKIAGWYYCLATGKLVGTPQLYVILNLPAFTEITLHTALAVYSEENRQRVETVFRDAATAQQPFDIDVELITADGHQRWTRIAGTPVHAELRKSFDIIGIIQDIGDRKAIELNLAMQQQQLEVAIASSNAGKFHYTGHDNLIELDAKARKLFNLNSEQSVLSLGELLQGLAAPARAAVRNTFREGRGSFNFEIQLVDQNGAGQRVVEINGTVERSEHNATQQISGLMFDITQRKEWEAAINQASKSTLEMVQAKAAFLANMSHEIRTPMHGIIGMLQMLQNSDLSAEQVRFIQVANHSAQNLLGIINDILDYSKLDAQRIALESQRFRIADCVSHTVELLSSLALNKGLVLDAHVDANLPAELLGDPFRIEQVLSNFVSNAIKFTPTGFVHIKVYPLQRNHSEVRLRVEVVDTGPGIPAEAQTRLFTPFEQVDNSITRKYGGTGLGLSICKQLVQLMAGELGVRSEPGQGATFWFEISLPIAVSEPQPGATHTRNENMTNAATEFSGRRILLVEDNRVNQIVACEMLRSYGIDIEVAENGRDALEKFQVNQFNLIFMDMQMPVMDGLEATRQIRKLEQDRNSPPVTIVAMTANAYEEDKQNCLQAGMNDFLSKPFTEERLHQVLIRWLLPDTAPQISIRNQLQ